MQPLFELISLAIIEVRRRALGRYGNHQEIISRKLEQTYTPPDTRLEWPGEGPLFEYDSNKGWGPKWGHY